MSTTTAAHPALDPDEAARALIEEARRRQRHRWRLWAVGAVVLCLLVGGVAYVVVAGSGAGGGGATGGVARSHAGAQAGATHGRGGSSPAVSVPPTFVLQMGVLGRERVWAASCSGLYVTDDGGGRWATVTPTNLQHTCVSDKLSAVAEVGTEDLWVAVDNLPGFLAVPPPDGGGSTRGNGIDYSTDGGATWQSSVFPGCTSMCGGNISLSFVDARHGWAEMGTNALFSTGDGGATWTLVGHPPFPSPAQIDFVTSQVGWASGTWPVAGGGLFRTTDGGATWTPVALPPVAGASGPPTDPGTPIFFGPDGVTAAWDGTRAVVYTTADGGTTWRGWPTSVRTTTATGRPPAFSAAGPADWVLADGSTLLATRDAGARWTAIAPKPAWANRPLPSIDFTSASTGWVLASVRTTATAACGTSRTGQPQTCTIPALLHTADGGRTWTVTSP